MLARSAIRVGGCNIRLPRPHIIYRASFSTTARHANTSVTATWNRLGQRAREVASAITPDGGILANIREDEQNEAQPLNLNIFPQLTPTLRKLTLVNKVAVVTGYVM